MVGGLLAESPSASLQGADPSAAFQLIEIIEKLPPSSTGAFVFGPPEQPFGAILVEEGRVCWAAAAGLGYRLTDILVTRLNPGVPPSALKDTIRRCRLGSMSLGDALIDSGVLSSVALREALCRHTSEVILALSLGTEGAPVWLAHRKQRYDARFTFSPAELLSSIGACCRPDLGELARIEIEGVLRLGGSGLAYMVEGGASLFPICAVRSSELSAKETEKLGIWAAGMLKLPFMLRAVPRLVAALGTGGDALVTWLTEGIVYVVICPSPSSLAHVLGKRARASPDGRSGS